MSSHDKHRALGHDVSMSRTPRLLAVGAVVVIVLATGAGVLGHMVNRGLPQAAGVSDWWLMGVSGALAFGLPGGWLAHQRPRHVLGWIFLAMATCAAVSLTATEYGLWALSSDRPGFGASLWLGNWLWVTGLVPAVTVVPLLLPDGRPLTPRWRPGVGLGIASVAAAGLSFALRPYDATTPALADTGLVNPVVLPFLDTAAGSLLLTVLILGGPVVGVVGLVVRWRRARGVVRQQLKWVLWGVGMSLVLFAAGFALGPLVTSVAMLPLPVAIVVAALRYGLGDVDVVISRSLVYVVLTLVLAAVYVAVVGLLGGLLADVLDGQAGAPVVATALVAVAAEPVHRRLRSTVNRLIYGTEEDPLTALSRLGEQLGAAADPEVVGEQLLPRMVASVATSLGLGYVGVELADGTRTEHGVPPTDPETRELRYGGAMVGTMTVGASGSPLSRRTRSRLDRLADQVAVAAHTLLLSHRVHASREEAVGAREEERRRLYQDLHDGVGPALAAVALNVEVARESLATDPDRAGVLLDRVVPALNATVGEVRSVVHGLRPPALDDLGLATALRELASSFAGPRLQVRAVLEDDLSGLPAATEVATYRIAAEALHNASRHAGADEVVLRVRREDDRVLVSVEDDGRGMQPDHVPGVGIASMTSRAEEVGGRLGVSVGHHGRGTLVEAELPAASA